MALQNDSSENTRVSKVQASKVIAVQNEFYKKNRIFLKNSCLKICEFQFFHIPLQTETER